MQVFSPLVGVSFRGSEARQIVKSLTTDSGQMLYLEAEPENEYDDHAVKVMYGTGEHLGYLARENNRQIFEALQRGTQFSIEIVSFENSIKPVLLISEFVDEQSS